jgi:hypothetical protein
VRADALAYAIGAGTHPACPTGITVDSLGLSPQEETECLEKTRAALAVQKELLG